MVESNLVPWCSIYRRRLLLSPLKSAINCEESAILEGEIVVLNEKGFPDFQMHQRRINVDYSKDIERLAKE